MITRRTVAIGVVSLGLLLACWPLPARASALPAVTFREVKITGDEFVVVQANEDVADLSAYWLAYSSNDTAASMVPAQQLPAIPLKSHQAILLTSDQAPTCDAVYSSKLSVSLGDSKGALELRQLKTDSLTSTFTTVDRVNWIKQSTTDKTPVTDNLDLRKETGTNTAVWYHDPANYAAAWSVGTFTNCSLSVAQTTSAPAQTYTWPTNTADPPALIQSLADDATATTSDQPVIPAADFGLAPPQITELLPNPDGTGTDGTDEFIELYNPNSTSFDLSGFVLQTGVTTKHSYTFPASTMLPGKAFVAFYSATTGLSLSNTSGEADLLDPLGALLAQTDDYGTAKDGQSWALAKGSWYWTTQPTPNASNVIAQPTNLSAKSKSSSSRKTSSVKGASTSKAATASLSGSSPAADTQQVTPIHPWTLAVVAGLALAYGLYEYRLDVANIVHRFRRHRAAV